MLNVLSKYPRLLHNSRVDIRFLRQPAIVAAIFTDVSRDRSTVEPMSTGKFDSQPRRPLHHGKVYYRQTCTTAVQQQMSEEMANCLDIDTSSGGYVGHEEWDVEQKRRDRGDENDYRQPDVASVHLLVAVGDDSDPGVEEDQSCGWNDENLEENEGGERGYVVVHRAVIEAARRHIC